MANHLYMRSRRSQSSSIEQSLLRSFLFVIAIWILALVATALFHLSRWAVLRFRQYLHRERMARGMTRGRVILWFARIHWIDLIVWGLWLVAIFVRPLLMDAILAAGSGMLVATILLFRISRRPSLWFSGYFLIWFLTKGSAHLWPLIVIAGLVSWRFWPKARVKASTTEPPLLGTKSALGRSNASNQ
jgi:hypothetical protein